MPNLYSDLLQLQKIPGSYARWESYRSALTGTIINRTDPGSTVLIVGAGRCDDFDLIRLREHFSRVTLLDKDVPAMEEGVAFQGSSIPFSDLVHADLLGIPDDVYSGITDRMTKRVLPALQSGEAGSTRFVERFCREIREAWQDRSPDLSEFRVPVADHVICCGVHSQLLTVFPQMADVYSRYVPMDCEPVLSLIRSLIPEAVRSLNDALFTWAGKSVIVGLEERRSGIEGGIEGALQAAQDMSARGLSDPDAETLIWPFDVSRGKIYEMRISMFSA